MSTSPADFNWCGRAFVDSVIWPGFSGVGGLESGGWQTDKTVGSVAAVQHQGHTQTYISAEDRGDRDIEPSWV